jgi:type VI secretion system secreted protein Hcp
VRAVERILWSVIPVLIVVALIFLAGRAEGPQQAVSAPMPVGPTDIRLYLRIDGIDGECTDDLHKGCLGIQSFEQGDIASDPRVTQAGSGEKPRTMRLTVTRLADKLTPTLYDRFVTHKPIGTATLEVWREGSGVSEKVMVYTHHDCVLNAIRNMKDLMANGPVEELTFTCARAEWSWTEGDPGAKP